MVLGSTNQRGISVEPRHNQGLARRLRLAKGGALTGSGCVGFHTRIGRGSTGHALRLDVPSGYSCT